MNFKKIFLYILLAVVLVVVGLTALGYFYPQLQKWGKKIEEQRQIAQYDREMAKIKRAYEQDKDGGKTPEETFDMFLDALSLNDASLASKYYELSVQPKAFDNLNKEMIERGNLSRSFAFYKEIKEKGTKKCNDKGDGCVFEYQYLTDSDEMVSVRGRDEKFLIEAGSIQESILSFSLNQSSKIWKITQPY